MSQEQCALINFRDAQLKISAANTKAQENFGTRVLQQTGNLAAVMRVMGHSDPRIAMHYQHPDLEVIRNGF
jgi:hypothetical protein